MERSSVRQAIADTGQVGVDLLQVRWEETPLGPPETWPSSLQAMVRVVLTSRFSLWMAWGPDLTFFCNEAYRRDTLGQKYPWALGRPARGVWAEVWPEVGPRIEGVLETGRATWDKDLLLFLGRSGFPEETYHTFSYSPLSGDDGSVVGMLCVVSEETSRVIGERRLATLRDLGGDLTAAGTESEVLAAARTRLGENDRDFPFSAVYLFDPEQTVATVAAQTGVAADRHVAPTVLDASTEWQWPVSAALRGETALIDLTDRRDELPTGPWEEPPRQALITPLRPQGEDQPYGFLLTGLNPYRPVDGDYRGFIELVSGQIAAGIASARAYDAERRRAEELAELDRAKTTFFTNVSHEFRTPLTLLLGPAEDALNDKDEPLSDGQRRRLELVYSNAQRLLSLVNSLLDFSKLETGRADAHYQPTDLAAYTTELAVLFEPLAERAGLRLLVSCPPTPEPVYVDRDMWAKIVLNLLSNALKFTFDGEIEIRLSVEDDKVRLDVSDTGIGIAEADQARLFERFHRVAGARSRTFEGSGIGLALVAEMTHLLGGEVGVTSQPGGGSIFSVVLPRGSSHLPPDRIVAADAAGKASVGSGGRRAVAEVAKWLHSAADQATADRLPHGTAEAHRARVLAVDDNAEMRAYLRDVLATEFLVETATDGNDALEKVRAHQPDLIVTDVMMPELDGFGLLAAIRDDPVTASIPVIMVSARAGEDGVIDGLEAGADDYLIKPFSGRELSARVRTNVELDRARRARQELERSQSLLDQAQRLARLGSFEVDLTTGAITGSENSYRVVGIDPERLRAGGVNAIMRVVHPEDRTIAARFMATARRRPAAEVVLRIFSPEGSIRWLQIRAEKDGGVLRGSVQDITEQHEADQAKADAAAQRRALTREHQIADELQASLLPQPRREYEYLQVATYYQAGVEGTYVGGDWYDVIALDAQRTALVIGDVMGRGVRAAAVMGQLRSATRAYAKLDVAPGRVLQLLDGVVRDLGEDQIVTCVYGVHDAATGFWNYASAGHLPPLLRRASGDVVRLVAAAGPPLGAGPDHYPETPIRVGADETIVLYTDGLVERRGLDLDHGLNDLAGRLHRVGGDLARQPSTLVNGLLPDGPDDDIAVLMARVRSGASDERSSREAEATVWPDEDVLEVPFEGGLEAVPAGRRLVRGWLDGSGASVVVDAELILSELLTNAVLHGEAPLTLRLLRRPGAARVEVQDAGRRVPVRLQGGPDSMTGRGLALVDALASEWGVAAVPGAGKVVWADIRASEASMDASCPATLEMDALQAAWPDDLETAPRYTIRLGSLPTDLLIAAKSHVDNVVRELTLLRDQQARGGAALSGDMVALIDVITKDFAEARNEIKRQATLAASRDEPTTDLELHLPLSMADAGERYLAALEQIDRYARAAHLLTLAPPTVHRLFRSWYVQSLVDQLRAQGAGESPPPVQSFTHVLAEEVARLAVLDETATRLALLEKVNRGLVAAGSVEEMAQAVAAHAVELPGVSAVGVRLLTPEGTLRTVASSGDLRPELYPDEDVPLDADQPVAAAARSGQRGFVRSLADLVPDPLGPIGRQLNSLSAQVMPLMVGGQAVGTLGIVFVDGELAEGDEVSLTESLAGSLVMALQRRGSDPGV